MTVAVLRENRVSETPSEVYGNVEPTVTAEGHHSRIR